MFYFVEYVAKGLNNIEIEILYSFHLITERTKSHLVQSILETDADEIIATNLKDILSPNFVDHYKKGAEKREPIFSDFLKDLLTMNALAAIVDQYIESKEFKKVVSKVIKDNDFKIIKNYKKYISTTINDLTKEIMKKLLDILILNLYNGLVRKLVYCDVITCVVESLCCGFEEYTILYNEVDGTVTVMFKRDVESKLFGTELVVQGLIKKEDNNAGNL